MLNIDTPDLLQINSIVKGQIQGNNICFSGFSIDSRSLTSGNLFIAIKGDKFDGHKFVKQAKNNGAKAVLVMQFVDIDLPQIKVKDTVKALNDLALAWRNAVDIPVIGITGSNGKTTVKEMLANILTTQSEGLKTRDNFNNHIGVPLTLLRITTKHKWVVIEMGANHNGEIAKLTTIVKPTIALINNISNAHIAGFETLINTAKTKGAIFTKLPKNGVALIPNHSPYFDVWKNLSNTQNLITFGDDESSDCYFSNNNQHIKITANNKLNNQKTQQVEINLPIKAKHFYCNATAATAIALILDVKVSNIKLALENLPTIKGRLEILKHPSGAIIIDDTYNASPASFKVAIDYLKKQSKQTILILGDMGELNKDAKELHQQLGSYAKQENIQQLFSIGTLGYYASQKFGGKHFASKEKLLANLKPLLDDDMCILVKGSRFMKMDSIVKQLLNMPKAKQAVFNNNLEVVS